MPVSRLLDFFKKFPKSERFYLFESIIEDNFDYLIKTEDPVAVKLNTIFKNDTASILNKLFSRPESIVNRKRKASGEGEEDILRSSNRKKRKFSEELKEMEKHKTLNEQELISKFIYHLPDPKFLFLSTTSKIVCNKCLISNSIPLIKDINGWMHETCITNNNPNCFICRLSIDKTTEIKEYPIANCSEKCCEKMCHQNCYNIGNPGLNVLNTIVLLVVPEIVFTVELLLIVFNVYHHFTKMTFVFLLDHRFCHKHKSSVHDILQKK